MKKFKFSVAIVLLIALALPLIACSGLSKSDVVGTWSGVYTYNGNYFSCAFILEDNGRFSEVTLKNGNYSSEDSGTYEIKGNKVTLFNRDNSMTTYEYKNGKLYNNGHEFTKN